MPPLRRGDAAPHRDARDHQQHDDHERDATEESRRGRQLRRSSSRAGSRSRASHGFQASQLGSSGGERRRVSDRSAGAAGSRRSRRPGIVVERPITRPTGCAPALSASEIAIARKPKRRPKPAAHILPMRSRSPREQPRRGGAQRAEVDGLDRGAEGEARGEHRRREREARRDRAGRDPEVQAFHRIEAQRCSRPFSRPGLVCPAARLRRAVRMRNRRSTKAAKPRQVPTISHRGAVPNRWSAQ